MLNIIDSPVSETRMRDFLAILLMMCAVILSALAFEHIGGYQPCKLCLQQREPWYAAIPVMAVATMALAFRWPAVLCRGLALIAGVLMVYSFALALHHSGVEWGWWEGPGDCGLVEGGVSATTGGLLAQLEETVPPSCDAAPGRFLGLSFAGWNALASAAIAAALFPLALSRSPAAPA